MGKVENDSPIPEKQWQIEVFTSKEQKTPHTFYGKTINELREQVYSWLIETRPTYVKSGYNSTEKSKTSKGTIYWEESPAGDDEDAYKDFCERKLFIQKGPEYKEQGFVDGKFQLEYIKKISKVRIVEEVDRMLQRGWHIISLDKSEDFGSTTTYYILGHTDPGAS